VCQGDSGCTTTVLDGAKCYAPAGGWTPYAGTDITGTVPGYYWNIDADRAVVGWAPNPAYGPIPTMRLTYTRPTTAVTATDRWDDQCPALAAGGRCTVSTAAVCTDGPATKVIDGVSVYRDCWEYTSTMTCSSASAGRPVRAAGGRRLHPAELGRASRPTPSRASARSLKTATAARCRRRPSPRPATARPTSSA
jgi:conjugal transfer mating pair stabilization protein TraN